MGLVANLPDQTTYRPAFPLAKRRKNLLALGRAKA
jgi:hypothetical protein